MKQNLTQPAADILIAHSRAGALARLEDGAATYPGRPAAFGRYRLADGSVACMVNTSDGYVLRVAE